MIVKQFSQVNLNLGTRLTVDAIRLSPVFLSAFLSLMKVDMEQLQKNGIVIFLDASLETLKSRIHNYETRGLAKRADQTFADLFQERFELYTRYADIVIDSNHRSQEQVCDDIHGQLQLLMARENGKA